MRVTMRRQESKLSGAVKPASSNGRPIEHLERDLVTVQAIQSAVDASTTTFAEKVENLVSASDLGKTHGGGPASWKNAATR